MRPSINPISLRGRIIGAGFWVLGGHGVGLALRLGGNLIMTRLLVPEMFGIMAVATILLVGLGLFSDLGLRQNIIQSKRGDDPDFLNTVWTVQIIRGFLIWLIALGFAILLHSMDTTRLWPANSVYSDPILPYVIGVITLNSVINGFESTKLATANRALSLGTVTRIELLSQFVGLISMIVWALIDRSIWALIIGALVASLLRTILSHVWMPGIRNKLYWDKHIFEEIFQFGKWIFLTSIIGFMVNSGDRILLGGLVGTEVLGIYAIAFFLVDAVQQVLNKIIGAVVYPALGEVVRSKDKDLRRLYYRIRLPIDIVSLMGAGFIFSSGSVIVEILYDDRYLAAGHMLEVLCIALVGVRYNVASSLFTAMGKPKLLVPVIMSRLLPLYILLPLAFSWFGLNGALWIAGGSVLFTIPAIFYFKFKHKLIDFKNEILVLFFLPVGYFLGEIFTHLMYYLIS